MSDGPLENWGQLKLHSAKSDVKAEDGTPAASETRVELVSLPKGKSKNSDTFVSRSIVSIPVSAIASASATTKNDLTLTFRPDAAAAGGAVLTSLRFAIPDVCVGHEQTEEAGKEILAAVQRTMREYQSDFLKSTKGGGSEEDHLLALATMGTGAGKHKDEVLVGTFDDVSLSYPSGKYKIVISNYNVVLEDKKKGASGGLVSFPLSDLQQLYLCDVPAYFGPAGGGTDVLAQYLVLILKNPLKIRTVSYAHVVISCPADLVLDEEHPWRCDLKTQEEINKVLHFAKVEEGAEYPLVPAMSGRVSDVLLRTFKAVARVPAYGGKNKEYTTALTQHVQSCLRCLLRGTEGLLYVVGGGLLFLHRPATKMAYKDIERITLDEADSGSATFQITVYLSGDVGKERFVFSGIDKAEKEGLVQYLKSKVRVDVMGLVADDEDDDEEVEEDEEDGEGSEGDTESGSDDDEDFDSNSGSDDESEKRSSKRKRSKEEKERSHKRHKKEKREGKEKKHKKHKKHEHKHKHRHHRHNSEGKSAA